MNDTPKLVGLIAAFGVSTTVMVITVNRMIPTPGGFVGPDFGYFMPYLLAGEQWIHLNGWSTVPYFTPDFCGGMPWLANPQSIFYSVPQVIGFFTDFITAIKLTAISFAAIGALATYYLLRQCFRTSWQAATLGAVLFQLNGFLIFRIGIGHLTYHVFGLVPAITWCVLYVGDKIKNSPNYLVYGSLAIAVIGCFLAIIVYGGALNYVIPTILSVAAIILLHQLFTGLYLWPWVTLAGGIVWSIPLSALKLSGAFVLVSDYPRTYIERLLFSNPWTMISYLLRSLFAPELLPSVIVLSRGVIGPHELEFGMSVVPAFLIIAAVVINAKQIGRPQHPFIFLVLASLIAIPLVTTFGSEAWGRLLVRIPIVNNNTVLTRWYSIYILPIIVLSALSFDHISLRYREALGSLSADLTLTVCVLLASLQLLGRDLSYYTVYNDQLYDPAPIMAEARRISSGGLPTVITEIGPAPTAAPTSKMDALLVGRSALPCYEPLFGYRLEMFPARQLRPGPITDRIPGDWINMADPRCYLKQGEKSCLPGGLFRSEDISNVLAFASHQPLPWQKPPWQKLAELVTLASLTVTASALLGLVVVAAVPFRKCLTRGGNCARTGDMRDI